MFNLEKAKEEDKKLEEFIDEWKEYNKSKKLVKPRKWRLIRGYDHQGKRWL